MIKAKASRDGHSGDKPEAGRERHESTRALGFTRVDRQRPRPGRASAWSAGRSEVVGKAGESIRAQTRFE